MADQDRYILDPRAFRTLIDLLPEPIFLLDTDSLIRLANRPARDRFEAVEGKPIASLVSGDDLPDHMALTDVGTLPLIDGQTYISAVSPLHIGDRTYQLLRLQRSDSVWPLLPADKMDLVGALSAGAAHEVNNPLSGILQSVQLLSRALDIDSPPAKRRLEEIGFDEEGRRKVAAYVEDRKLLYFVDIVAEAGQRTSGMLNTLLRFTRRRTEPMETTDLKELIEKAFFLARLDNDMKKEFDFRSVEINFNAPNGSVEMLCDPQSLLHAVLNLLKYVASKLHQRQCDEPDLTRRLTLEIEPGESDICVSIIHNGAAIEAAEARHFNRPLDWYLERMDAGLPLAVCRTIVVWLHQGRLELPAPDDTPQRIALVLPQAPSAEGRPR